MKLDRTKQSQQTDQVHAVVPNKQQNPKKKRRREKDRRKEEEKKKVSTVIETTINTIIAVKVIKLKTG